MKNNNLFWISFSDLMTSLFFVMMMLFVFTVHHLNKQKEVTEKVLDEIKSVQTALGELDKGYFTYDSNNKRYKLHIPVNFRANKNDIYAKNSKATIIELIEAGRNLYTKVDSLIQTNPNIDYLVIVEGNAARFKNNYKMKTTIQKGYEVSYERALSLVELWKKKNINFNKLGNQCEVIIAGSGHFGKSREVNEDKNRNFTIQVTSKVGKLIDSHYE
jgi:preprotein translocase subunit YajC